MQIDSMSTWQRTHSCGGLRASNHGEEVILMGWVNSRRDLGQLIFIDLRDREGITQIVFDPQADAESHAKAHILRNEWVLAVRGEVVNRLEGQENKQIPTGDIEVRALELKILNHTETPPFQVDGAVDGSETLRLKHRYLELRRPQMLATFQKRHRIAAFIREYLNRMGFLEVETPFLTKSTPEGARDYLVPSRVNRGCFYALPQSPQLFKQLLMVAGFERYYQIVRCFRDEDLRADRQPEFTQVDMEMSFATEETVMSVFEGLMIDLFQEVQGVEIPAPIGRMDYREAMETYGTDRPDLRFGMEIRDLTEHVRETDFRVFRDTAAGGGVIKAIRVPGGAAAFSRKNLDELGTLAVEWGAKGLAWAKITPDGWQSPLDKFLKSEEKGAINASMDAQPGDLILCVAHERSIVNEVLGRMRTHIARERNLIPSDRWSFLWVTRFPLFEFDEAESRLAAVHHPFTSPLEEDVPVLEADPLAARARAYDLVLNGSEIGGGSVRIHRLDLQQQIFKLLGISPEQAQAKFGFLLEALRYGAPPHAGMAIGFDRLVALMTGAQSLREVIAFPKTTSASCLLTEAPSGVDPRQLSELGLSLVAEEESDH